MNPELRPPSKTIVECASASIDDKKFKIKRRQSTLEKTDLYINVLTYSIFEQRHLARAAMEELIRDKRRVLDERNNEGATQIEHKMAELRQEQEKQMDSMETQREALRDELKSTLGEMNAILDTLTAEYEAVISQLQKKKQGKSSEEIKEINKQIRSLKESHERDIQELTALQMKGWKHITHEEELAELLEGRGFRATKSGRFYTSSGTKLDFSQLECLGFLQDIDLTVSNRQLLYTSSQRSTTPSTTIYTSPSSNGMSQRDVNYLKEALGKPLVLALANITKTRPHDPVHYLAHYLVKYRYNQEVDMVAKKELLKLTEERENIQKEATHAKLTEETEKVVDEMVHIASAGTDRGNDEGNARVNASVAGENRKSDVAEME